MGPRAPSETAAGPVAVWLRRWAPPSGPAARSSPPRSTARSWRPSLLDPAALDLAAADLLGSTTHISAIDAYGMCASVTCWNGSGSGVLVPGTGVILNNMLGEEDLNPLGFLRIEPGPGSPR